MRTRDPLRFGAPRCDAECIRRASTSGIAPNRVQEATLDLKEAEALLDELRASQPVSKLTDFVAMHGSACGPIADVENQASDVRFLV